ncbi:Glutathione transferase [Micromonospora saelicesensis]|uniref:Glutathione transferase n=1 Tax=Micromonospora saelicesensis TaxID=285676 RepID=A0A328NM50_9ACTN|nr:SRPBCC domain-containing protein [Micromonospora saelicesensis]RAO34838.1 Glutathione transferase [Micromonospora saelicesensis]
MTNLDDPLVVHTPGDREIVLSRLFEAPAQLVFAAFTRPELLARWYGARGWRLTECDVDLRIGGRWRFVSQGPEGARMVQSGVYQQIEPPHRLVCTELFDDQSYPGETLVSHEFSEVAGRTTVTTTLLYATAEGRNIVLRYPMARGVGQSFTRLADLLHSTTTTEEEHP